MEAGKIADIVAVDGDALADICVLQERKRIQLVMKQCEAYIDRRPRALKRDCPRRARQLAQDRQVNRLVSL
jgi:hypothetical protein